MKRLILLLLLTSSLAAAEPRRYIVEFTPEAPAARGARAKRFRGEAAEVVHVRREFTRVLHGAAVELREGQSIEELARLPYVAAIHPDGEVIAFGSPSEAPPLPQHARGIGATSGGSGIVVAVLDTGIDGTHPALAGKVVGGYDFVNDDADPMDDHQHGTHVAGIIAAQSNQMTGVAPNVRLLAYKVLNHQGRGSTSGVIAAIERAVDPNGDGNLSDHADVINLSLGDRGHPEDALSRAVDNAVAAGAVVVVASGNEETFHRIGSPAGAAKAITVGASTTEEGVPVVAYFTSRGPATRSGAIKPDVLAPGRDIYSTGLDHGYVSLSGTSMATPHVSGLAALLIEEHADWTPERVKAAIVTTAQSVAEEEVMTQGSGIADLLRARENTLVASPTQVNFGLDGLTGPTWSSTRTITLHNSGNAPKTVQASLQGATGAMTMTVQPSQFTLAAGQSRQVEIALTVDHATLGYPQTRSFSFGGMLVLDAGSEEVRLPWAFVRAGRATITSDGSSLNVLWLSELNRPVSPQSLGAGGVELLVEPGVFDFVIASKQEADLRLVIAEQQHVEGDVALAATAASAPHEIRFEGSDDRGTPFPNGDGNNTLRSLLLRLVLPGGESSPMPDITGRRVHTSSFSDRFALLSTESFVDRAAGRIHLAQYAPLRAVHEGHVMQVSPGDYGAQEIELTFAKSGTRREIGIMPRDWPRNPLEHRNVPPSIRFPANADSWSATLFMTREVHPDFASGVQFSLYTADDPYGAATLITPMLRRNDDGFFAVRGFGESPLPVAAVAGEPLSFGASSVHLPGPFHVNAYGLIGEGEIYGDRGDRRRADTLTGKARLFDEGGTQVAASDVTPGGFFLPTPQPGRYKAEMKFGPFPVADRIGEATLTSRFGASGEITAPPMITSFAILDGAGRHTTRLPANGNGTLVFSAADYEQQQYRRIVDSGTNVFFRRRGTNTWLQLTAVIGGEESSNDLGRYAFGLVHRVDLANALQLGPGEYEVAIEVTDEQGDSTSWQIAPAFIVDAVPPGGVRRRAVGK